MAPDKLRPGVEAAIQLWETKKTEIWEDTLNSYNDDCRHNVDINLKKAQIKLSKHSFAEDDKWKEETLPKLLKSQEHITLAQLERLMIWKLRRGQFRPTLMGLIRRNNLTIVQDVSSKAIASVFSSPINTSEAIKILVSLQGVGPATASLILSVISPDTVPFMSDEAMDASLGLPRSYTASQFEKFKKMLSAKAKELGNGWNVGLVEKALFTAALLVRNEK